MGPTRYNLIGSMNGRNVPCPPNIARISRSENGHQRIVKATSDNIPGLVAQGGTIAETVEIARDVARELIGSYRAC